MSLPLILINPKYQTKSLANEMVRSSSIYQFINDILLKQLNFIMFAMTKRRHCLTSLMEPNQNVYTLNCSSTRHLKFLVQCMLLIMIYRAALRSLSTDSAHIKVLERGMTNSSIPFYQIILKLALQFLFEKLRNRHQSKIIRESL